MAIYKWKPKDSPPGTASKILVRAKYGGKIAIHQDCCCDEGSGPCEVCHPCITVYVDADGDKALGEIPLITSHPCYNRYAAPIPANVPLRSDGVYVGTAHPEVIWVRGRMYFKLTIVIGGTSYTSQWVVVDGISDTPPLDCLGMTASDTGLNCANSDGDTVITSTMKIITNGGFCGSEAMSGANLNNYTASALPCGITSTNLSRTGPPSNWTASGGDGSVSVGVLASPPCGYEADVVCPDGITTAKFRKTGCGGPTGAYFFHSTNGQLVHEYIIVQ